MGSLPGWNGKEDLSAYPLLHSPAPFSLLQCCDVRVLSQPLSPVRLFAAPWTVARWASLSMGFSRQEYWSGLPCPPAGDLPTQGLNPGLLHCRQIFYHLSHQGSPRILEWVIYPFSRRSSRPRNWTGVSCIAGGFFTNWATRKAQCCDSDIKWGKTIGKVYLLSEKNGSLKREAGFHLQCSHPYHSLLSFVAFQPFNYCVWSLHPSLEIVIAVPWYPLGICPRAPADTKIWGCLGLFYKIV